MLAERRKWFAMRISSGVLALALMVCAGAATASPPARDLSGQVELEQGLTAYKTGSYATALPALKAAAANGNDTAKFFAEFYMARIYADMQRKRWYDWIGGRHYARTARAVHALFIDVNELTDRSENALKIIGDVYAARLFSMVGARLGLSRWKTNVGEKLTTLDDIYRFLVERVSMARGQFLELTVVIILVLELFMLFAGIGP